MKKILFTLFAILATCMVAQAKVAIEQVGGWFESGYVTWSAVSGATNYEVYVKSSSSSSWTKLDKELVRKYPTYYRADAVGLKAGQYSFKVVPMNGSNEMTSEAAESSIFTATAHDRSGFAHVGMSEGIGAYKNDGTLKSGAKVIYVSAASAKTVSTSVQTGSKSTNVTVCTGLQAIITAYQKGCDTTPLAVRIIGTIKDTDMDGFDSSAEGLQVKGKNAYSPMPITFEGIGDDAAISGFGILCRNCKGTEFRNFAIMLCMDDCLSIDTDNSNLWIHNMDFFYGKTGGDADQAKGDGTVDIKAHSKNVTVSYNHFYDAGKCSLGGMSGEQTDSWHTYHHNWFDHSDSRHPRIRVQFFHVYNNYYDGNSKYGVGCTSAGSALVENNYFRNCKYPMLTSKQGTDAEGDGTFSGEPGGVIKACNNIIVNPRKIQYNTGSMTDGKWDAVLVESRDAEVTATCLVGGTGYNSEADLAARTTYIENKMEDPSTVVATVTGELGAGRMHHGDFTWTFLNSAQDENDKVIGDLKTAMTNYKSTLVGFADGTAIPNGGASSAFVGGDQGSVSDEVNRASVPSWGAGTVMVDGVVTSGGGDGPAPSVDEGVAVLGGNDYFWFNKDNEEAVNSMLASGAIEGGTFAPAQVVKSSDGTVYSDRTGSIRLAQNGTLTFFNADGITKIDIYTSANGNMTWQLSTSDDGTNFTNFGGKVTGVKGDHPTLVAQFTVPVQYVRLTNLASGNRDVQGVKLFKPSAGSSELQASNLTAVKKTMDLNLNGSYQIASSDYTTSSTGAISYSSSDANVVAVSSTGLLTAKSEGTATITVTQAADNNYKAGKITISVKVVDPRAASTLQLTSSSSVTVKVGETSQIDLANAAGELTYKSAANSIATVSSTGEITGVAAGTTKVTVTDAGTENVKGGSVEITVTVESDNAGGDEGDDDPTDGELLICDFASNKPSSSMVKVAGNYSDVKGTVTYDGKDYTTCVKIETSTKITITPTLDCDVTLVFDLAAKRLKLDGTACTTDGNKQYSFEGKANTTYTLTKGDAMNLFLVIFTPKSGDDKSGDINNDKVVDVADAVELISKIVAGTTDSIDKTVGDMDGNGSINIEDAKKIVEKYLMK